METISSMKRKRNWRPSDGYEPANSSNMFLDLKSGDNDREEYLSDKVREYLMSLGMLSESKLPDMMYKELDDVISSTQFWSLDNDYDMASLEVHKGQQAIQTEAAYVLNTALNDYFASKQVPYIIVIESVDPEENDNAVLDPSHRFYPNEVALGGMQTLSPRNQIMIVVYMATFSDDYDVSDISSSAITKSIARVIRHEAIHGQQLDKRKKKQGVSRASAKQGYEDEGQILDDDAPRVDYLKSHIEVDAYAHEIAEELLDYYTYDEALKVLTDKNKAKSSKISDQAKEYLYDNAGSEFTTKLIKKIYTHLGDLEDRRMIEQRIRKSLNEALTSYDVEDVYSTARLAHLGQMRRDGKEYFTHPKEVAKIVRKYYPRDTRAYLVALLHDTIEDTEDVGNLSVKELTTMIDASIGDPKEAQDIISAVNALTHAKNQPYTEYVQGLTSNPMALKVKLADMMHNLSSTPTERQKLKYEKAIDNLSVQHSGNIPGVSMQHVSDLLKLTESRTVTEFMSTNQRIFERSYVTDVLGIKLPLNESHPYSPVLQRRIIQEQLLLEGFFSDILDAAKEKLISAAEGIKKYGKEAWSVLSGFYLAIKEGAAKQLSGSIAKKGINKFLNPIYAALKWLAAKLPNWNMPKLAAVAEKGLDLLDKMRDKLNSVEGWKSVALYSGVAVGLQWLWNEIGDWVEELKEKVGGDFKAAMGLGEQDGDSEDASKLEKIKEWLKETAMEKLKDLVGSKFIEMVKSLASAVTVTGWWKVVKKIGSGAKLAVDALGAATERFVSRHNHQLKVESATMNESNLRKFVKNALAEDNQDKSQDIKLPAFDAAIDGLEVQTFEEFTAKKKIDEALQVRFINESFLVTAYGTVVSAAGIAKLLGYAAKGIAKALNALGLASVDPEKEGQTFFKLSHKIHHFYINSLVKLAAKMGVPKEKQQLAGNVMFGVLLGTALSLTGIELYGAIKAGNLGLALGEGGMAGIKVAENAEAGASIMTLVEEAFGAVPELAGTIVDTVGTAGEVTGVIDAMAGAGV